MVEETRGGVPYKFRKTHLRGIPVFRFLIVMHQEELQMT